jgi:putative ABC transport system substrate-binding protein
MNHKKIVGFFLGTLLLALSVPIEAQQAKKVPRVGFLIASSAAVQESRLAAFRDGLRELGYVEGKNILIEYRYAEGKPDRLPDLAAELLRLKVDIILAAGGTPPALAAKNATRTIPIVMTNVADAVGDGLVADLARPGGNVTGLSTFAPELSGKRLELLKDILPGISRVAVLANRDFRGYDAQMKEIEAAAQALGLQLQPVELRGADDLENAFSAITAGRARARAIMTLSDPVTFTLLRRIVELAIKSRLPSIHLQVEYAEAGGLVSYGPSYADLFRRAATYVDKILKGVKPADLPVEQPTKFELVINLKSAKQIGLTIPPNVLARADKVIR